VITGLRYARGRPELLGTYLVDINAMFFGMPQALYPFLATQLGGAKVLGLLYAAPAVGSLLATVGSGWTGRVHRHGLMVTVAAALWGVGIIGVGLSHLLWLTLFCLAFAGAADMISGIFRMIIWSQTIPDHLRGRLAGIEMLSYTTGPLLGQLRSGAMARTRLGVGGSIWIGGVLCVAGTALLAAALPRFVRYDGEHGMARKKAEDEAWAATAKARA
jgi:MFS family permease